MDRVTARAPARVSVVGVPPTPLTEDRGPAIRSAQRWGTSGSWPRRAVRDPGGGSQGVEQNGDRRPVVR